jgi:hypothetical protein
MYSIELVSWSSKSDSIEEIVKEFSQSSMKCCVYEGEKEKEFIKIKPDSPQWIFLVSELGLRVIFDHHLPGALLYFIKDGIMQQRHLLDMKQLEYLKPAKQ